MRKPFRNTYALLFLLFAWLYAFDGVLEAKELIEISNKYIKVFVNATEDATGRFACDTTGGDPKNTADDNKPLIYGRPVPWTSYTTVRVDGKDFVFGGPTRRRAGVQAFYGERVAGPRLTQKGEIECIYRIQDLTVTQLLAIVKSTTTGLPDTCEIRYIVANEGKETREVGFRIMLDTMVGANDGAPFRVRENAVTADTFYSREGIPPFWQAFDSLSRPSVTSQGTLSGGGATVPDRLYFTNWGSAADSPWDFDFRSGRDFTRAGEYELDSSVVMFFDPKPLPPGELREYVTLYGLGGISFKPGVLALGVTSPAEVHIGKEGPRPFPVIAYVQNDGEADALSVRVALSLPPGLKLSPGQAAERLIGNMTQGETRQVVWDVIPTQETGPEFEYSVKVWARNAEENSVERSVRLVAPPRLTVELVAPGRFQVRNDTFWPYPMRVNAIIKNVGGTPAYRVRADMVLSGGLRLAPGEKSSRLLGNIQPGGEESVTWQVVPLGPVGSHGYTVSAGSANSSMVEAKATVGVPELGSKVALRIPGTPVKVGSFVTVDVVAVNLPQAYEMAFDAVYDREVLELVRVSRGTGLYGRGDATWDPGRIERRAGAVRGISGKGLDLGAEYGIFDTLAGLHFRVRAPGKGEIRLENLRLLDRSGRELTFTLVVGDLQAE